MELTLDRDKAAAALGKAHGVISRANTIPILNHVLLRATADGLEFQANDTVMETVAPAAANVATPGEITVGGQRFYDMLRALPAGGELAISLSSAPARLVVKCGRSRFQLPTLPAADFPLFDKGTATHRATLPAKTLAGLIDRVAFAQSKEQTRYHFCGVYLHTLVEDGNARLRAVATDGSRLGYDQADAPEGWADAPGVILPSKTVGEARRLLEGLTGDIEMWTDGRLWGLNAGGARLASKVVDGSYPDYARVIPRDPPNRISLDVGELSAALKRCGIMAAEKTRMVKLALDREGLTLRSRDGEGGEIEEPIGAEYAGDSIELGFNGNYLQELVAQMSGETLNLALGGAGDPALITDPLYAGATYVCMPLRV